MSNVRTFKPRQDTTLSFANGLPYDVQRAIALYGRHSKKEQNGNVATTQQTVGLERVALRDLGFAKELHRTFYEDLKGVSAYKVPMDERKSYSDLYNAIIKGEIGTVLCYMVDRLFRTANGQEWELFINACVKNNVIVITTSPKIRVYDLSTSKDADDFRAKCMAARTYIEEIVKGRMNAARDELGRMGLWAGQSIPSGFYIDLDDTSDTYKQYLVYEPHAAIIRALFKRYRELNGASNKLMREIEAKQPLFPLFESLDKIPNVQLHLNEAKTGYVLGYDGIYSILSNPMYIGVYTFQDVRIRDNHPAIVNEEDFFYAFNRLSRYDLEGNEQKTVRTRTQGYSGEKRRGVDALLRGKLSSSTCTDVCVVSSQCTYSFLQRNHGFIRGTMEVAIATLDCVVSDELVKMLGLWKNFMGKRTLPMYGMPPNPYNAFEGLTNEPETVIASIDDQIPHIEARIAKLRRNLDLDVDAETLASWASELKHKVSELARLKAKQKAIAESQTSQQEARELMKDVPEKWEKMSFEKRVRAIELFVQNVDVVEEAPHFLRVRITWKLPYEHTHTFYAYRRNGTGHRWTDEEKEIIRRHYEHTPTQEMLALLPNKSWVTIWRQASLLGVHRLSVSPCLYPKTMTMQDIEFVQTHGFTFADIDLKADVQVFYPASTTDISEDTSQTLLTILSSRVHSSTTQVRHTRTLACR